MTELEVREVEVRSVDTDARTITGLAVPYGETIDIGGYRERFERGALSAEGSVPLFASHDHRSGGLPIGKVIATRDAEDGYEVTAVISSTPKGDEVYALLRDGVLDKFSVGFEPIDSRMDGDTVVRTAARLREVSVVPFPAYSGASISEVREDHTPIEEDNMTVDLTNDVAEVRSAVEDLDRRFAALADVKDEGPAAPQFRDAGEFLKALARGDKAAQDEIRAADGNGPATSAQAGADARNSWLSRPLKLVQEKRRVINLFATAPLPSYGNTIEYPVVASTAGTVEKQSAEGAALAYMEVELGTGTAGVSTYGGYSSLSRQAIERSDAAYLSSVLQFQALQYAKATEAATRAVLLGATGTGAAALEADSVQGWMDVVIDSSAAIEDGSLGLTADFMLVSRDVFKQIAHKVDASDRPVFAVAGDGQNTVGRANLVKASANVAGLPVVVDSSLAAGTCIVASADALTTLESAGAPFRLQDENIVNLSKDFSLYGYMANTLDDAKGIVVVDTTPGA